MIALSAIEGSEQGQPSPGRLGKQAMDGAQAFSSLSLYAGDGEDARGGGLAWPVPGGVTVWGAGESQPERRDETESKSNQMGGWASQRCIQTVVST